MLSFVAVSHMDSNNRLMFIRSPCELRFWKTLVLNKLRCEVYIIISFIKVVESLIVFSVLSFHRDFFFFFQNS